jgi:uncharacterized membrane protein YeaQ/YmgE (transglycosylase-associated protein family)
MGILSWIVFGILAGFLARFLAPGPDPGGCLFTIIVGILGAIVGGFIGTRIGWGTVERFDLRSLGLAVLGGVIVLLIRRMLSRRY